MPGSGDHIVPETSVDTAMGSQNFSRRRILTILGLTVFIVAIPLIIGRTLYTVQGVSRNAYMTELILPTLFLLAALGGVLVLRQVLGKGVLDVVWCRWNRNEVKGSALAVLAILIVHALTSCLFRRLGWATGSNHVFYAEGLPAGFFIAVTIYMAFATPIIEELFWRGSV